MPKLSYLIKNNTQKDYPLKPGEAWKFIVQVEDKQDAYTQMSKCTLQAGQFGHTIMNVFFDNEPFDAREWFTDGANSDNFDYDEKMKIDKVIDETS